MYKQGENTMPRATAAAGMKAEDISLMIYAHLAISGFWKNRMDPRRHWARGRYTETTIHTCM